MKRRESGNVKRFSSVIRKISQQSVVSMHVTDDAPWCDLIKPCLICTVLSKPLTKMYKVERENKRTEGKENRKKERKD